jgi:hypothetical protein
LFPAYSNNLIDEKQGIIVSDKPALLSGESPEGVIRKTINLAEI